MQIHEALKTSIKKLESKNITSAILDAEVLLSHILKKSKEFILTYPEKEITQGQLKKFNDLFNRRAKGEQVAYLTGHQEFYGLDFLVNKNVLIPRPETELVIDETRSFIKSQIPATKYQLLDIGTGSGCIAIALKKYLPKAQITATDISKKALAVAEKNAGFHKTKIKFIHSDLLNNVPGQKWDIIITNPPYLDKKEADQKQLAHEPQKALYGGKFGLEIYEKLFQQIKQLKYPPKLILGEIGHAHITQTKKLAKEYFPASQIQIKKDLCGKNRILKIVV